MRYDVSVVVWAPRARSRTCGVSAALSGRTTIEINPADTPLSNVVGVRVQASAGAALREIYGRLGVHCGVSMASRASMKQASKPQ